MTTVLSARLPELPVGERQTLTQKSAFPTTRDGPTVCGNAFGHGKLFAMKTRTLLILAVLTGLAIIVAFALQILVDGRFLG